MERGGSADVTDVEIRRLVSTDRDFHRAMFVSTVSWREEAPPPSFAELVAEPSLALYIAGWGREGDDGVVATSASGMPLGAAWYRLFTDAEHGYGFVSDSIPELGIAVVPEHRGRGVGRRLMAALVELARTSGYDALSLSVDDANDRARRVYNALGFAAVGHVGTATTMVLRFRADQRQRSRQRL